MYTEADLTQFKKRGLSIEEADRQLKNFETGFEAVTLTAPAVLEDGIITIEEKDEDLLHLLYEKASNEKQVVKMVPASGSATRMFKELFSFLNSESEEVPENIENFFGKISFFPFAGELRECLENDGLSLDSLLEEKKYKEIMGYILVKGLGYGATPKGLVKFHSYSNEIRTPFDEHMVEGALYGNCKGEVRIHFTVSEEYLERFKAHLASVEKTLEKRFGLKYNVTFSVQKPSTDTLSLVCSDNSILRDEEGNMVFRPGGHGALIYNLDELDADIIFIKNIDNVSPDKNKADTCKYKKLLAGTLLNFQEKIFSYLRILEKDDIEEKTMKEIVTFVRNKIGLKLPAETVLTKEDLVRILNRPIRVCGMVKNEGEPGGGPFWVKCNEGERLMICESAQIDLEDEGQKKIFDASTHFNPVDLVCGIKDYRGNKFNLTDFIAYDQGFINYKSYKGKDIKVQELPGLWNGAMANWTTLFVEVPVSTFTPVKTVFDLLKPEHQNRTNGQKEQ